MMEAMFWITLLCMHSLGGVLALCLAAPMAGFKPLAFIRALLSVATAGSIVTAAIFLGHTIGMQPYFIAAMALVLLPIACFIALWLVGGLRHGEALRGLGVLAVTALAIFVVQAIPIRFAFPCYTVPSNSMSPTVKGLHLLGVCPHCGSSTVVSVLGRSEGHDQLKPADSGICTRCYRVSPATNLNKEIQMGDRIVANRLALPRRWDLVAFRFPPDPKQIYLKRLVALPGETIEVRDGAIFIDGQKLASPPEIAELTWHEPPGSNGSAFAPEVFAIRGQSLPLDTGQYFVLGDNSPNAYDSRYWGSVPKGNLIGVVDGVYFPPRSWKTFPRH
jgi:signal peptidase I